MPQYIDIEIRGRLVARMTAGHHGGSRYRTVWWSTTDSEHIDPDVDTGVGSPPTDQEARRLDSQNDFIHARRAIAAAAATARQFLDKLAESDSHGSAGLDAIVMRLRTDFYDRATVTITPREQATADLRLEIGAGPIRVPNARPPQVSELCVSGVTVPTFTSALALALHLLDSEGPGMSIALAKTADPSVAIASFRYSPALSTNQAIRKTLGGASPGEIGSSDSPKIAAYALSAPFPALSVQPPSQH